MREMGQMRLPDDRILSNLSILSRIAMALHQFLSISNKSDLAMAWGGFWDRGERRHTKRKAPASTGADRSSELQEN
jgi:hypothetical protein